MGVHRFKTRFGPFDWQLRDTRIMERRRLKGWCFSDVKMLVSMQAIYASRKPTKSRRGVARRLSVILGRDIVPYVTPMLVIEQYHEDQTPAQSGTIGCTSSGADRRTDTSVHSQAGKGKKVSKTALDNRTRQMEQATRVRMAQSFRHSISPQYIREHAFLLHYYNMYLMRKPLKSLALASVLHEKLQKEAQLCSVILTERNKGKNHATS